MKKYSKLVIILFIINLCKSVVAQDNSHYKWDKELVQKVKITDKDLINKLVMELFIPESQIDFIEIFDVDGNGAAEGDLLKVHPSKIVYPLYQLSKNNADLLSSIPHFANTEDIGLTLNINKNPETAQERILLILATAIKELYSHDKPLKLYFEQNNEGIYKFELLGYHQDILKGADDYIGIGGGKKEIQKQKIHSLLKALYEEFNEEFINWQPTVIHVIKTEKDTVIIPEPVSKK